MTLGIAVLLFVLAVGGGSAIDSAKAIAAGFDVHTSAGILQKFYLEQTQKYTKEVQP